MAYSNSMFQAVSILLFIHYKSEEGLYEYLSTKMIATMRNPMAELELGKHPNVLLLQCDVTKQQSIENAVAEGINHFGRIDVFVNNAGIIINLSSIAGVTTVPLQSLGNSR